MAGLPVSTPVPGGNVVQFNTMTATPLAVVMERERAASAITQQREVVKGLAGYLRECWSKARDARRDTIDERLYQSVRARRGEYDPDKRAAIAGMGGSDVYANVTSVKCRAAGGWVRDVMLGTGSERPWALRPTPVPDLPQAINDTIVAKAVAPIKTALMTGQELPQEQVVEMVSVMRDQALAAIKEEARVRADRMADKMEDQLIQGGFLLALDAFIDDITTFPAAIIKGPVMRKKPVLIWKGAEPTVEDQIVMEWERRSPFDIYPSPSATSIADGWLIDRQKLTRGDLNEMIDVEGYDNATIRVVLDEYSRGGLTEWLNDDSIRSDAEGKATTMAGTNPDGLIDALQFWGSVPGKWLIEWGMDKKEVPDITKEYHVECWLIGQYVIKAVLNYDPLCRKPYYKASYEDVPGSFWGNSVADLVRPVQTVVNASARAIVNNMAMSSGPQVAVNIDRLPPGERLSTLEPWHIWQVTSDPTGSNSHPVEFFQPNSNVAELMAVFDKFSQLADEYSGIPRYLTGDTTGGAGRTASGLSMLINNAGKSIKQVIGNIDMAVMTPLLERLYYHNMRYAEDPDLKGDVAIVARGASALIAKEAAQVRRNEFLQATANPIDMQIVGVEGRAAILRETAKNLDMDADKIVPPIEVLRQKWAIQQQSQQPPAAGPTPSAGAGSGQALMDGAPTVDNFSPPAAA